MRIHAFGYNLRSSEYILDCFVRTGMITIYTSFFPVESLHIGHHPDDTRSINTVRGRMVGENTGGVIAGRFALQPEHPSFP